MKKRMVFFLVATSFVLMFTVSATAQVEHHQAPSLIQVQGYIGGA